MAASLAEVLYFGDAPGYAGYSQANFRVPAGVPSGPDVSVRLTYLGRPSNAVTIALQLRHDDTAIEVIQVTTELVGLSFCRVSP